MPPGPPHSASKTGCTLAAIAEPGSSCEIIARDGISTCSSRCRAPPDRVGAELPLGRLEALADVLERGVADAVEAGLEPGARAGDHVVADLLGGQVGVAAGVGPVGVRRGQRGRAGAERAVGDQVAGQPRRRRAGGLSRRPSARPSRRSRGDLPRRLPVGPCRSRVSGPMCGAAFSWKAAMPRGRHRPAGRAGCLRAVRRGRSGLRARRVRRGVRPARRGRRGSSRRAPRGPAPAQPRPVRPPRSGRRRGSGSTGAPARPARAPRPVGGRPSGQPVSSQPWPTTTPRSGAFSAKACEVVEQGRQRWWTPVRSSPVSAKPVRTVCTWASTKPGVTRAPRRSTTSPDTSPAPSKAAASSSLPMKTIRSSSTATHVGRPDAAWTTPLR